MERTLVISDIHGELEKFEKLLHLVDYEPVRDQLILLGDYVDRGSNACGVLEKVISLHQEGAFVLKGNHEDMMIQALTSQDYTAWNRWVNRNGGSATLHSYGFTEEDMLVDEDHFSRPSLISTQLQAHLEFVQGLTHFIETDEYIFVHAGVDPHLPLDNTDPHTLMWIRDKFHQSYNGDKIVVFGHTSTSSLHKDDENYEVYFGVNRIIGIDGGAVYGGQLNCLVLPEQSVYSIR